MVSEREKRKERWKSPSSYRCPARLPVEHGGRRPEHVHGQLAEAPVPAAPVELGDRGLGRGHRAVDARQAAQGVVAQDRQLDVGVGQALAEHGVADPPVLLGQRHDPVELAPEAQLVAEQGHAALEGQGGEGHPPAVAHLAHDVVGRGAGPVEEHLVELGGPGELA